MFAPIPREQKNFQLDVPRDGTHLSQPGIPYIDAVREDPAPWGS